MSSGLKPSTWHAGRGVRGQATFVVRVSRRPNHRRQLLEPDGEERWAVRFGAKRALLVQRLTRLSLDKSCYGGQSFRVTNPQGKA